MHIAAKFDISQLGDGKDKTAASPIQAEHSVQGSTSVMHAKNMHAHNGMETLKSDSITDGSEVGKQDRKVDSNGNSTVLNDLPPDFKKDKEPNFDEDDPFAALDWKDGIATLPGEIKLISNTTKYMAARSLDSFTPESA